MYLFKCHLKSNNKTRTLCEDLVGIVLNLHDNAVDIGRPNIETTTHHLYLFDLKDDTNTKQT